MGLSLMFSTLCFDPRQVQLIVQNVKQNKTKTCFLTTKTEITNAVGEACNKDGTSGGLEDHEFQAIQSNVVRLTKIKQTKDRNSSLNLIKII